MNIDRIRSLKIYRFFINIKHFIEYAFYHVQYIFIKKKKYKILSDIETVNKIVNEHKSMARFGDGEFKWIIGMKQENFQEDDPILTQKLIKVLCENNDHILIGIPSFINDMSKYSLNAKKYWTWFLLKSYKKICKYLNVNKVYCDSYITRPYLDIKNKNKNDVKARYENLKRIWNLKNIIIIEGKYSRLGLGNDLFDNAESIRRIVCPPQNAFRIYDKIKTTIMECNKDNLFILSLGPTATVLAYELSMEGYQCIDIGHIDIEYMWFLNGAVRKEKINGKHVNEIDNNGVIEDITDEVYKEQVIKELN